MVVFTCNHCGDSLQKPRVEKHYSTICNRNPKSLTCVDCLKDFRLEEYVTHTKCISETERYAAKGTVVGVPKGEKKQQSWVEQVQQTIQEERDKVSPNIRNVFELIEKYNNIPKKKRPFLNFLTSACNKRIKSEDIEETWNILERRTKNNTLEAKSEKTNESEKKITVNKENHLNETNGEKKKLKKSLESGEETTVKKQKIEFKADNETSSHKKKKRKSKSVENHELNGSNNPCDDTEIFVTGSKIGESEAIGNGEEGTQEEAQKPKIDEKFSWEDMITKILQKKPNGLSKSKLESKVSKKYEKSRGPVQNREKFIKKLYKKLGKLDILYDDDVIKIKV